MQQYKARLPIHDGNVASLPRWDSSIHGIPHIVIRDHAEGVQTDPAILEAAIEQYIQTSPKVPNRAKGAPLCVRHACVLPIVNKPIPQELIRECVDAGYSDVILKLFSSNLSSPSSSVCLSEVNWTPAKNGSLSETPSVDDIERIGVFILTESSGNTSAVCGRIENQDHQSLTICFRTSSISFSRVTLQRSEIITSWLAPHDIELNTRIMRANSPIDFSSKLWGLPTVRCSTTELLQIGQDVGTRMGTAVFKSSSSILLSSIGEISLCEAGNGYTVISISNDTDQVIIDPRLPIVAPGEIAIFSGAVPPEACRVLPRVLIDHSRSDERTFPLHHRVIDLSDPIYDDLMKSRETFPLGDGQLSKIVQSKEAIWIAGGNDSDVYRATINESESGYMLKRYKIGCYTGTYASPQELREVIEQYTKDTTAIIGAIRNLGLHRTINSVNGELLIVPILVPQGEAVESNEEGDVIMGGAPFIGGITLKEIRIDPTLGMNGSHLFELCKGLVSEINSLARVLTGRDFYFDDWNSKPQIDLTNGVIYLYITDLAQNIPVAYPPKDNL